MEIKIDTRVGKFFPIREPFQVVAEIQPIHWTTINQNLRLATKSLSLFGLSRPHPFRSIELALSATVLAWR
jgi:hypothetical protein